LLLRCKPIVLFFPSVEEMSWHVLDVNGDVHSNDSFLVIGTSNVVVGEDPFASSKKVFELKDPVIGQNVLIDAIFVALSKTI